MSFGATIGLQEVKMHSSKSFNGIDDNSNTFNTPFNGSVHYWLRSRTIHYVDKFDDSHTTPQCVSHENITLSHPSSIPRNDHIRYSLRNYQTEDFGGESSTFVNVFAQQLQKSTSIRGTTNDVFDHNCTIKKLPNEIMTLIFSYLTVHELSTSVAPVCKDWYILAHSPILWRKLCFNDNSVTTKDAKYLLKKSPLLSELIISNRDDVEELLSQLCWTNRCVKSIVIKRGSNTKMLNSWEWTLLRAKCLNRLIKCCSKIQNFELKEVNIRSGKFFHDLGILLPNFTSLHLSYNHFLTPTHIMNIATKCCNLTRLWLSGESCCQSKGWEEAYHTLFQKRWKTLTHLQLDASKLTDYVFKDISLCKNLKMLHLHKASHFCSQGLNAVGMLHGLLSLRLHKANHKNFTFLSLFQSGGMKALVNLSLAGCLYVTDDGAATIALNCPQLHMLSLALIESITDRGVEIILKHCSSLHYLDLFCVKNVTGSSFSCILQYTHELNYLVVEEQCDNAKEEYLKLLMSLKSNLRVYRTYTWKTGGTYRCELLQ